MKVVKLKRPHHKTSIEPASSRIDECKHYVSKKNADTVVTCSCWYRELVVIFTNISRRLPEAFTKLSRTRVEAESSNSRTKHLFSRSRPEEPTKKSQEGICLFGYLFALWLIHRFHRHSTNSNGFSYSNKNTLPH